MKDAETRNALFLIFVLWMQTNYRSRDHDINSFLTAVRTLKKVIVSERYVLNEQEEYAIK